MCTKSVSSFRQQGQKIFAFVLPLCSLQLSTFALKPSTRAYSPLIRQGRWYIQRGATQCAMVSSFASNGSMQDPQVHDNQQKRRPFRILALHGKGGTAPSFRRSLSPLLDELSAKLGNEIQCDAVPAPLEGGKWWDQIPLGSRSYEAVKYDGYELSSSLVMSSFYREGDVEESDGDDVENLCQYDVVFGHSQGAILLVSMLAQGELLPKEKKEKQYDSLPTLFILNGVAWPNPFSSYLHSLRTNTTARILFVVGKNDDINPPEGAYRVRDAFVNAGFIVETLCHDGRHSVPVSDEGALRGIASWIAENNPADSCPDAISAL